MWHLLCIKCQGSGVIQSECGISLPCLMTFHDFNVSHNFDPLSFEGFSCLPSFQSVHRKPAAIKLCLQVYWAAKQALLFVVYRFRAAYIWLNRGIMDHTRRFATDGWRLKSAFIRKLSPSCCLSYPWPPIFFVYTRCWLIYFYAHYWRQVLQGCFHG